MSIYHKRVYIRQKNSYYLTRDNKDEKYSVTQEKHLCQTFSNLSSANNLFMADNRLTSQEHQKSKLRRKLTQVLQKIGNNQIYMIFMSVLTIYTIFAIDIDKAFFNVDASTYFSSIHSIAIGLFVIQIVILSVIKPQYFMKFYFWIDCFSTLTMFLQLIWIQDLMSGASNVTVALSFAKVTKASRLSKIGARSTKIMKLIRLVKLIKFFQKQQKKQQENEKQKNGQNPPEDKEQHQEQMDQHSEQQLNQPNDKSKSNKRVNAQQSQSRSSHNQQRVQSGSSYGEQSQFEPQMRRENTQGTFNPAVKRKGHFNNLHQPFESLHPQLVERVNHDFQELSIKPEQEDESQLPGDNMTNRLYNDNLSRPADLQVFLNAINLPKTKNQIQSKFIIPPTTAQNNLGNNLSIPEIYQPSQMQMQSHQMISEDDKNNIEEIMKIFFTQNLNHFIEKGKNISHQASNLMHQNQNQYNQRPKQLQENQDEFNKKDKEIEHNRQTQNRQTNLLKQENLQQKQLSLKQNKIGFKLNESKNIQFRDSIRKHSQMINSNRRQSNQKVDKMSQLSIYDNNQSGRNSGRLSFMRRKQLLELSKNKQFREKFNRSYNVVVTLNEIPFSNIVEKMQKNLQLPPINRPNVDPVKQAEIQKRYNQLLQKIKVQNQPKKVLSSENLKVGQVLKEEIQKNIVIMVMGLIMILPIITADTWFDSDPLLNSTGHLFMKNIMQIPSIEGRDQLLTSFIEAGLSLNTPLQYFFIPVNETCCQFPLHFPSYMNSSSYYDYSLLRLSEQTIVVDGEMTVVFSKKSSSQITSYLNLARSLFITILLIFCSVLFMKDIENYALSPLEKMSTLINKISTNPFQALKNINQQKNNIQGSSQSWSTRSLIVVNFNPDQQQLQTNILSNAIIKITSLLTIGAGEIGSQIISKNIQSVGEENSNQDINDTLSQRQSQKLIGQSIVGVFVYLELRGFDLMCDIFGQQIFRYVNKITDIVHSSCIQLGGIPIEYDGRGFLLLFKPTIDLGNLQMLKRKSTFGHSKSHIDHNGSQRSFESGFQHGENDEPESNILCNLAILAMNSLNKIILQINQLEESKKLYQCILQKYPTTHAHNNNNNMNDHFQNDEQVFSENYEPHLVHGAVHVGECFYGSLGSQYKLECKCIGYDIAFTRHLCHMISEQNYGVSNILSEDIYMLLSSSEYIVKKMNVRQIDQVRIKEVRFKDYRDNPSFHFTVNSKLLKSVRPQKESVTKFYTFDFYGKLEMYSSNDMQLINPNQTVSQLKLNKTLLVIDKNISSNSKQSINKEFDNSIRASSQIENFKSKQSLPQHMHSLSSVDESSVHCLMIYKQRQKWLGFAENDESLLLLTKIQSEYGHVKQSRMVYDAEFFTTWNEALQSYYAQEFTDALVEFKYLHTFNQPYYDSPSRVFINRLQNINLQELDRNLTQSQYDQYHNDHNQFALNQSIMKGANTWTGVHDVVWKL